MINRYLERKVHLESNIETQEIRNPIQLEYYLVEGEIEELEELKGIKAYGIEIVKFKGDKETERQIVKNFCCKESMARETISRLADNTVTPSGLYFVLDDIVGI